MKKQTKRNEYWVNLLIDFLAAKTTPEEQQLLFEWIEKSEDNKLFYTQLKEIWVSSGIENPHSPFHKEKAFRLFKERMEMARQNKQKRIKRIFLRATAIAAVLIPFVALLYISTQYVGLKKKLSESAVIYSSVTVPKGSQSQVELPDGSQVWLNAGSSLQYANTFGRADRDILLDGEAYFEVTTNEILPFIVKLGDIQVQVLGTRFNVKAYEQLNKIKVALIEGSVSLQNLKENQSYLLESMETAIYHKQVHTMEIVKEEWLYAQEWINGDIIFEGELFEEIVFILEQRFDVNIHIHKESLKKRQFKGDFIKNEPLERILNVMATDGRFNYKITGKNIDVF